MTDEDRLEGTERRRSRRRILGDVAVGAVTLGGAAEAAKLVAAPAAAGTSSRTHAADAKILNFLLSLEELQTSFFDGIARDGRFSAEIRQFAKTTAKQDKAHADALRSMLGAAAAPTSAHVQADPKDDASFVHDALALKEAVVAAYIGEAPNLHRGRVTSVATIVSVEARHAAWIRSIGDVIPAPRAADRSQTPVNVVRELEGSGIAKLR